MSWLYHIQHKTYQPHTKIQKNRLQRQAIEAKDWLKKKKSKGKKGKEILALGQPNKTKDNKALDEPMSWLVEMKKWSENLKIDEYSSRKVMEWRPKGKVFKTNGPKRKVNMDSRNIANN